MYLEASVKGAELYVENGESVSLFPPDSEQFQEGWRCHWRQLMGPKVQLDGCKKKKPSFEAPDEGLDKLLFEVTLENDVDVITDTVLVFVGDVLGEVADSLGEAVASSEEMASMMTMGAVIGPKIDEAAMAMDVGTPVADEDLESWTEDAQPISMEMARGLVDESEAVARQEEPVELEAPVMPKQGFAKMLTMVRGWIGEEPSA
jgi:hypothetical protein